MIKPTINGVLDIMKACLKAKTVRRLVFTSSAGTVNVTKNQKLSWDENCWSDVEFCRRAKMTGWVRKLSSIMHSILKHLNIINLVRSCSRFDGLKLKLNQ
jgi:bifunctional dihydroflavonol 4-reductase/flavanone 4-reductase